MECPVREWTAIWSGVYYYIVHSTQQVLPVPRFPCSRHVIRSFFVSMSLTQWLPVDQPCSSKTTNVVALWTRRLDATVVAVGGSLRLVSPYCVKWRRPTESWLRQSRTSSRQSCGSTIYVLVACLLHSILCTSIFIVTKQYLSSYRGQRCIATSTSTHQLVLAQY